MGSFVTDCSRAGPYSVKQQGKGMQNFWIYAFIFSFALQFDFSADNKQ
jgi:hypothetical protein